MANTFALILTIATAVTFVMWCLNKFVYAPRRKAATANQPDRHDKNKKMGWFESLASLFPVLALVLVVRSFIYEPFQIPSGSMMPTLLVGDFILVEKFAYGIKDPLMQTTLVHTGEPKRGDIVVFKYPLDTSVDYIKRVIGLPGDRISYDPYSKELTVQTHCNNAAICSDLPVSYSAIEPADYVFTLSADDDPNASGMFLLPKNENKPDSFRLAERKETIDKVTHNILLIPGVESQQDQYYQQPNQPVSTWVVPAGHYFMMGDNRDNSADSRYWGFVPEKALVGKATFIWLSLKKREGQWPTGVRFDRIGVIHNY